MITVTAKSFCVGLITASDLIYPKNKKSNKTARTGTKDSCVVFGLVYSLSFN